MSNKIIYSMSEYHDKNGTFEGYYHQFKTANIELNKTYVVHPKTWQECKIKIVSLYDDVALGIEIEGLSVGRKRLYNYGDKENHGFKYDDNRYAYRLQDIK